MKTLTIEVLEPKAIALLKELEKLNLIKVLGNSRGKSKFNRLLETCRKKGGNVDALLALADIAKVTQSERLDLAMELYAGQQWSRGQAMKFSGLDFHEFRLEQAKRKIPVHYPEEGLESDIELLNAIG